MKKLLFIIILIPFIGMAQITDNLFVEFNRVFVDDLKYTDKDINLFSPDMSSSHNSKSDIEMGVSMSLGYNFLISFLLEHRILLQRFPLPTILNILLEILPI